MKSSPIFKIQGTRLPDLFTFVDGRSVSSRQDWLARRSEIKAMLQDECYGRMPPPPEGKPVFQVVQPAFQVTGLPSVSCMKYATQPFADSDFRIVFDLYVSGFEDKSKAHPVILCGDGCWNRVTPEFVALVTSRGYALAVFDRSTVMPDCPYQGAEATGVPDYKTLRDCPLVRRYPEGDFGALAAWAWGFSRIMDVIEEIPGLDAGRVTVCGHSRGGKASLLAGAFDERFAVVVSNGSGAGGSGCWRFQAEGAEPLESIVKAFPTWFSSRFACYASRMESLPFDLHFLKALCAPRPLLSSEGLGDAWANPAGVCVTHDVAREAYRLLGCSDDSIALHFRNGGHGHLIADWTAMLDFCDSRFFGKALPWDPLYKPYEGLPSPFDRCPTKTGG